jgi:hypothetical protein
MPYVRATGTAAAGGDRFAPTRQVQEGFGDVVVTTMYELLGEHDSGLMLDIGAKAKFASGDKKNDLITTGKNDYSLQADFRSQSDYSPASSRLAKPKGDPDGIDYRDPWYSTVGLVQSVGAFKCRGAL